VTADSTGTILEPTAFPGRAIFITAGLILETRDEAKFAGTLAHAMAHVLARHLRQGRDEIRDSADGS
jgi:predicted Zn-dependent protease